MKNNTRQITISKETETQGINIPEGQIPVTFNFDNSKVIGGAKVYKDSEGNLMADITFTTQHDKDQSQVGEVSVATLNNKLVGVSFVPHSKLFKENI